MVNTGWQTLVVRECHRRAKGKLQVFMLKCSEYVNQDATTA